MTSTTTVREAWRRIDNWLSVNAPRLGRALCPPAPPHIVAQTEAALGLSFPPEFRESLAVHDGQDSGENEALGTWALLSLDRAVETWEMLVDLAENGTLRTTDEPGRVRVQGIVRPRWWDQAWIPIASDGTGDLLCLDMNPPPAGRNGQIILYRHDRADREMVAPTFAEWLERIAEQLESGRFMVSAGGDRLKTRR